MSGIQRYEVFVAAAYGGPYAAAKPSEMGDYILHSDHEAEIARLRAKLADAHAAIESKAGWEWKREADRLRAEVEKYRVDAQRYRWLKDGGKPAVGYLELMSSSDGWDAAIDAAMGEGK